MSAPPGPCVAARLAGSRTYTGRPCTVGHVIRYTSTGVCCECHKAKQIARRLARPWSKLRTAARAAGRIVYYSHRQCPRHHGDRPRGYTLRYVSMDVCVECQQEADNRRQVVRSPECVAIKTRILAFLSDPARSTEEKADHAWTLTLSSGLTLAVVDWDYDVDTAIADALEAAGWPA